MNSLRISKLTGKEVQAVLPISLLLACLLVFSGQYIIYACAALLIIFLAFVFGERVIYGFVIVTLFTLVGDVNESLRAVVHIIDFSLLGYLFIRRFGLQFHLYPRIPKSLIYFLALYYFSMITASVMSEYPFAGIGLVIRQTVFFVIVYFFYALIRDEKDIKTYFSAIIIAAFILAASSIYTLIFQSSGFLDLSAGYRSRITGLISNPNNITNFYMICFPLVISVLLLNKWNLKKAIGWFLILFLSFALFLTLSRSAIIGVILSTAIIFFILRRKYFYSVIIFLIVFLLILLFYDPLGNVASILFRFERGVTGRDYLWTLSFDIIKDHPIFGIGPGAYKYEMFKYFPVMLDSWIGELFLNIYEMTDGANLSHNFFLFFFSDMGIFGLITSLVFPIIYFNTGIRTLMKYKDGAKDSYYLVVALFAIGTVIFVRSFVENIGLLYYGSITTDLPFWLVFISLIYYDNHYSIHPSEKKKIFLV